MSKYDIIIIGSGLGGLECGAILSKEGYHVCVLEKNELFGGCFQTYQRGGHRMDTGIHYIGSLDEGQIMNQYFRYFGIMDKLSIKRMDEEVFDRIYYKDAIYDYAMGHERFMETLCHSFPHERENLKRYVAAIRSVGDLISTDHLKKAEKEYPQLVAEYFGGPSVGVYNARQIKKDTLVTSSIALIIIIVSIMKMLKSSPIPKIKVDRMMLMILNSIPSMPINPTMIIQLTNIGRKLIRVSSMRP